MNIKENYLIEKYGLKVRYVQEYDAERILKLRVDEKLSKHLHKTENDIDKQLAYIRNYKLKEYKKEEFYFAFVLEESLYPIGFYRIHDINYNAKTFTIGSWIFEQNCGIYPVLADILLKEYGFEYLNLEFCYFDVRKMNKSVLKYHSYFSPIKINEERDNVYFCLKKCDFINVKENILGLLL